MTDVVSRGEVTERSDEYTAGCKLRKRAARARNDTVGGRMMCHNPTALLCTPHPKAAD